MPECRAEYLLGVLFEIGMTLGDQPLTHGEIESYQRNIGIRLNAWEVRTIKRLSETYLSESYKATDKDADSAWSDPSRYQSRKFINDMRVRASLRETTEQS